MDCSLERNAGSASIKVLSSCCAVIFPILVRTNGEVICGSDLQFDSKGRHLNLSQSKLVLQPFMEA
jgi:hypothetical protein